MAVPGRQHARTKAGIAVLIKDHLPGHLIHVFSCEAGQSMVCVAYGGSTPLSSVCAYCLSQAPAMLTASDMSWMPPLLLFKAEIRRWPPTGMPVRITLILHDMFAVRVGR